MYIVNTSFMVEPSVHDRWLKFVTEKYIPALRARGFGKVVFTRVLSVDAEDHFHLFASGECGTIWRLTAS